MAERSTTGRLTVFAFGSVAVAVVVLALKYAAYRVTGSVALFSDALESIINVATALAALWAIRVAALPPDQNHPFGHSKAEYVSAVAEGVLIVVAAALILREAYFAVLSPRAIEAPALGLALNAAATALNAAWAAALLAAGRRHRSPALAADARHLFTDVVTSVGVVAGVGLAALTGIGLLDPIVAALVALNILWMGWRLVRESVGGLMDEAVAAEVLARIREAIATNASGAMEAHDLRTRQAGRTTFVEFHLVVAGSMSVSDAHDICDRLEQALRTAVEGARVTIHVEPENKAKHAGIVVL